MLKQAILAGMILEGRVGVMKIMRAPSSSSSSDSSSSSSPSAPSSSELPVLAPSAVRIGYARKAEGCRARAHVAWALYVFPQESQRLANAPVMLRGPCMIFLRNHSVWPMLRCSELHNVRSKSLILFQLAAHALSSTLQEHSAPRNEDQADSKWRRNSSYLARGRADMQHMIRSQTNSPPLVRKRT